MRSFSFIDKGDFRVQSDITGALNELKYYFYKYNGVRSDEAMQRAYIHALNNFDESRGELIPYLKSLARTIMLTAEAHIPSDSLDEIIMDEAIDIEGLVLRKNDSEDIKYKLSHLALCYMNYFLQLGDIVRTGKFDLGSKYFPQEFKDSCVKLIREYGTSLFLSTVLCLYREQGEQMRWFVEQGCFDKSLTSNRYCEADFKLINDRKSKRVKMIHEFESDICLAEPYMLFDPDKVDWGLQGQMVCDNTVLKVKYVDLLTQLHSLVKFDQTTPLIYWCNDLYCLRTGGGSLSAVNSGIERNKELLLAEIITNVLLASFGRLLGIGSESLYVLTRSIPDIKFSNIIGVGEYQMSVEKVNITF